MLSSGLNRTIPATGILPSLWTALAEGEAIEAAWPKIPKVLSTLPLSLYLAKEPVLDATRILPYARGAMASEPKVCSGASPPAPNVESNWPSQLRRATAARR